ncbi:hypothetical protein STCU_11259 [Strigomonas culicis]|uniref:Uncharacterized protein n=1 Tax=Strigomonas culicis TaxID=28005 RepID=S9TEF9_9TRYP|nr:hypothetical protein STCU_11259 [Strigomonas culicis]|eukprot:EPY16442.1 hypothetical protein STCU_11259 [Strigomonas culicis]
MAQFQYRPPFMQANNSNTTNATSADLDRFLEEDVPPYDSPTKSKNIGQLFSRPKKENEPVIKFVLHRQPVALQYNPSINMSTSKLSPLVSVYVVHAGGRVVIFNRSVLDVFVRTAEEKLDGKRPNFTVDWSPDETSYPVAGAAAHFARQIQSVYTLRRLTKFSGNESLTYKKENAARIHEMRSGAVGNDPDTIIRDASYFLFSTTPT